MKQEQESALMQWFDHHAGPEVNAKAKEVIHLLAGLVVGTSFTSGILLDNQDLHAHYVNLIKTVMGGLYDSGDAANYSEDTIAAVYNHLTGEQFEVLQAEWAADMEDAVAQNRALLEGL